MTLSAYCLQFFRLSTTCGDEKPAWEIDWFVRRLALSLFAECFAGLALLSRLMVMQSASIARPVYGIVRVLIETIMNNLTTSHSAHRVGEEIMGITCGM